MAYSPLPIKIIGLDKLKLDLDNYRIPTSQPNQSEAMEHLFAAEDVLSLLKLILRNGYFDNEMPVVTSEMKETNTAPFVILEGNRRVTALKALSDPSSIPGYEKEVRTLLNRYAEEAKNLPNEIRVLVAPSRTAAEPHIARLHTGLSKKGWTPDQQAKFYYSRLRNGVSVDDLKAMYPGIQIPKYLKMASMRQYLSGARFSDQSLRSYAVSADLKMSSLEYAYRNSEIAEAIGVKFDKTGLLLPLSKSPQEIGSDLGRAELAALEYLLGEFRAGRLNTRSDQLKKGAAFENSRKALVHAMQGNNSTQDANLLDIKEDAPHRRTSGDAQDDVGSVHRGPEGARNVHGVRDDGKKSQNSSRDGTGQSGNGGTGSRGPNRPGVNRKLEFAGITYDAMHVNLKHRYYELRTIDVVDFPVAASILLRSVLEATIKAHFEPTNVAASGMLSDVFKPVRTHYGSERSLKSTINKISSGKADTPGTLYWFNEPAHNADTTVIGAEVHQAWRLVSPLLRHLLRPAPDHL